MDSLQLIQASLISWRPKCRILGKMKGAYYVTTVLLALMKPVWPEPALRENPLPLMAWLIAVNVEPTPLCL